MGMSDSVTLKREELYAQVLAEPIIRLAGRYGITGTGLAKICRKMGVPVPPPGFWQRKRVGRPDPQPPLPPLRQGIPGVATITKPGVRKPTISPETAARLATEDDAENRITVSDRLVNPHALVRLTRDSMEHGGVDDYGALFSRGSQQRLDIRVSKTSLARALRILDALFKALEARGAPVKLGTERWERTYVAITDEKVKVRLEEVFKRIDHVLTKKEREEQEKWGRSWARKWEYEPTGLLRFRIEEYVEGARKSWSDGGSQRLEEMLNDIVKGIVIVAEALRVRRIEREREERERREALEQRAKLEQLRREEGARRLQLERQVERWVRSRNLRAYLDAVEQTDMPQGLVITPDSQLTRWLTWAREYADILDPLKGSFPPRHSGIDS